MNGLRRILLIIGFLLIFSFVPLALIFTLILREDPPTSLFVLCTVLGTAFLLASFFLSLRGSKIKNGILAIGTIVSLQRTGMLINHQPQVDITLRFTTGDGQQITAIAREIVPLTHLAQIQPGTRLPLRYSPENPQKIMIDEKSDQTAMQDAHHRQMVADGITSQKSLDIANNGVKAQGVVLSAQPTGTIIDGRGEMALHIKVTRPNGGTFETTVTKAVPQNMLASVQPGSVIHVFYLPGNEKEIAIGAQT